MRIPFVSGMTMIFNQVSTALFGVFLAAYLKADIYGTVNLSRNLFLMTLVLSPLGLDLALQRHIGASSTALPVLAAEIFWNRVVTAVLSIIVFLALLAGGASFLETHVFTYKEFGAVLLITMASLPFATDMAVLGGAQRGLSDPVPSLLATYFIQPASRIVFIIGLLAVCSGLWAVVYGTFASFVAAWIFLTFVSNRALPLKRAALRASAASSRQIFRYAPLLGFSTLMFTITRSLDTVILGYFTTIADVGRYGIVLLVSQLVATIGASLGQTLGPRFSAAGQAGDHARLMSLLADNVRLTSILCAPLCIAIAIWGCDIDLLLGPTYRIPRIVFVLAAASQFIMTVTQNSAWPLVASGRQNLELVNNGLVLLVQIVACLTLIPRFGIAGAAGSTLIALATIAIVRQIELARFFGGRVIGPSVILPLAASALVAVPVALVYERIGVRAWWLTGIFAASHVLLSFAAIALVFFRGEGGAQVRQLLARSQRG